MKVILSVSKILVLGFLLFNSETVSQDNYALKWIEESEGNAYLEMNDVSTFLTIERFERTDSVQKIRFKLRNVNGGKLWEKTTTFSKISPYHYSYGWTVSNGVYSHVAIAHSWFDGNSFDKEIHFYAYNINGNSKLDYSVFYPKIIGSRIKGPGVFYSPDGTELITKTDEGEVKCWTVNSQSYSEKWERGLGDGISYIVFSPDNQPFVIVLQRIYNQDGEQIASLILKLNTNNGETDWFVNTDKVVNTIAVSLGGAIVAFGTSEGEVIEYYSQTGTEKRILQVANDWVGTIEYAANNRMVTNDFSSFGFNVWDASSGSLLWSSSHGGNFDISNDGSRILSAYGDQFIELRNMNDGSLIWTGDHGNGKFVITAHFATDQKYIVSSGEGFVTVWEAVVSDIEDGKEVIVRDFELYQNYPNPFNPSTNIRYSLQNSGHVRIELFNSLGQYIKTLLNGEKVSGDHELSFNAGDLPNGVYIYKLITPDFVQARKMTLIK